MTTQLKRIYAPPAEEDGCRVLVDHLWPRGVKKADAALDMWIKEVAPSEGLRKWFHHDPEKWEEFKRRYFLELDENLEALIELRKKAHKGRLTLVYASKEERYNNAVALKEYLETHVQLEE